MKKKIQNGRLKKRSFFTSVNSQYFFVKILWIRPWVSRIGWCEGHWCGSTYMAVRLPNISSKTAKNPKKAFFACFWAYVGQSLNHIGWATSMPFASINPTDPRTNPQKFYKRILRIGDFEKLSFFKAAILNFFFIIFFFLHPHENQSKLLGYQGWVEILMITLVYSKRVSVRNNLLHSVPYFYI